MTDFVDSPRVAMTTPLGPVECSFVGDYVSMRTDAHINDDKPCFVLQGHEYLVHVFLYEATDWTETPPSKDYSYNTVHMTHRANLDGKPQMPEAKRKARVVEACRNALLEYLKEHPEVLREAKIADAMRDLNSLEPKVEAAKTEYDNKRKELRRLQKRLAVLEES